MSAPPIFINIAAKKKTPPVKKRKQDDVLPKGQLTLTQMPGITFKKSVKEAQEPDDDSTIIPGDTKQEEEDIPDDETVIFTVGDLVQMQHDTLEQYVQLGIVKMHHGCLVEVYWLWHAEDGAGDNVYVPKVQTVNPV